jgi:hypothetical protein
MTSAARSAPLEVMIADWAAAGLTKPSIARLDRLVTAEKPLLYVRLGELSAADKDVIRAAWNRYMTL